MCRYPQRTRWTCLMSRLNPSVRPLELSDLWNCSAGSSGMGVEPPDQCSDESADDFRAKARTAGIPGVGMSTPSLEESPTARGNSG